MDGHSSSASLLSIHFTTRPLAFVIIIIILSLPSSSSSSNVISLDTRWYFCDEPWLCAYFGRNLFLFPPFEFKQFMFRVRKQTERPTNKYQFNAIICVANLIWSIRFALQFFVSLSRSPRVQRKNVWPSRIGYVAWAQFEHWTQLDSLFRYAGNKRVANHFFAKAREKQFYA